MLPRPPRRLIDLAFLAILATQPSQAQDSSPPQGRLIGFSETSAETESRAESAALAVPTPENARAWLRTLTEEPHVAGTPADRKTAEFVRDKLREWGWDAELAEYKVLLNYPIPASVKLEVVRPEPVALDVTEKPHAADKDSTSPDAWPAFHGYGVSGDVTGQVVYANYGRPEDFAALERLGVAVEGKIVLVRYGGLFRGLKVLNAQKRGAIGVLIYSDPADDGYMHGDVYPDGPFRPGSAIQRGSVQFLSHQPGDPSTPDGPSIEGAKRLPIDLLNGFPNAVLPDRLDQARGTRIQKSQIDDDVAAWERASGQKRREAFATIPSLPISYDAARPMLDAMGGPNVPSGWQGGLPLPYHVGPGPVEVHFAIRMDYAIRPIWNVIATLKGTAEPDRWVMVGNHRDAWTYGAVDPSSGTAATMEMCRALGQAVKGGWKPRRTIVYASWDAEEYGLVGSTEWAEHHADELKEKAVLMLNVDAAVGGRDLSVGGIPSLRDLFLSAAADVNDPRTGKPLARQWLDHQRSAWASSGPIDLDPGRWDGNGSTSREDDRFSAKLSPLGSGSDYTAFVDHLGIPAIDVDFGGGYGVYHSIYDDFFWMEKFCDPEFLTHATAARLYTLIAMRAAASDVVPLTFRPYAEAIRDEVDELRRTAVRKGRASGRPFAFAGLAEIVEAVRRFSDQAEALDRATAGLARRGDVEPGRLARVNDALTQVERAFLIDAGLPGRPWFKHGIYAPGLTTGYAAWPLPGVRQALVEDKGTMLAEQAKVLVDRLGAATEAMRRAAELAGE
jgi:N-acetylated-alpha-linked acidic dipeptidase